MSSERMKSEVFAALTNEWQTSREIQERIGWARRTIKDALYRLLLDGQVEKDARIVTLPRYRRTKPGSFGHSQLISLEEAEAMFPAGRNS